MEGPYPQNPSLQEIQATRWIFFIIALPLFAHHDFFHIAIVWPFTAFYNLRLNKDYFDYDKLPLTSFVKKYFLSHLLPITEHKSIKESAVLSLWGMYFFHVNAGHRIPACVRISGSITSTITDPESHAHNSLVDFFTDSLYLPYTEQIFLGCSSVRHWCTRLHQWLLDWSTLHRWKWNTIVCSKNCNYRFEELHWRRLGAQYWQRSFWKHIPVKDDKKVKTIILQFRSTDFSKYVITTTRNHQISDFDDNVSMQQRIFYFLFSLWNRSYQFLFWILRAHCRTWTRLNNRERLMIEPSYI